MAKKKLSDLEQALKKVAVVIDATYATKTSVNNAIGDIETLLAAL